jgi:hypothetical protein
MVFNFFRFPNNVIAYQFEDEEGPMPVVVTRVMQEELTGDTYIRCRRFQSVSDTFVQEFQSSEIGNILVSDLETDNDNPWLPFSGIVGKYFSFHMKLGISADPLTRIHPRNGRTSHISKKQSWILQLMTHGDSG